MAATTSPRTNTTPITAPVGNTLLDGFFRSPSDDTDALELGLGADALAPRETVRSSDAVGVGVGVGVGLGVRGSAEAIAVGAPLGDVVVLGVGVTADFSVVTAVFEAVGFRVVGVAEVGFGAATTSAHSDLG
jgi:hypothetical protein